MAKTKANKTKAETPEEKASNEWMEDQAAYLDAAVDGHTEDIETGIALLQAANQIMATPGLPLAKQLALYEAAVGLTTLLQRTLEGAEQQLEVLGNSNVDA